MPNPSFQSVVRERIKSKFSSVFLPGGTGKDHHGTLGITSKGDNTLVTEIDTFISEVVHQEVFKSLGSGHTFYSEEDHDALKFPAVVLDPIDGTRELVKGVPECALSMAVMRSPRIDDPANWAWIYNPFTGLELDSNDPLTIAPNFEHTRLLGLVSRSEWNKGIYERPLPADVILAPRGSIAFKLMLLAGGSCDFVFSARPKNLWDIAAGSVLCASRGIHLYGTSGRITELPDKRYNGPLLWCPPVISEKLLAILK